jgi:hypothetical protein
MQQDYFIRSISSETPEAVGVFSSEKSFVNAVNELYSAGFSPEELETVSCYKKVTKELGHDFSKVEEIEDAPNVSRFHVIPEEINGGINEMLISSPILLGVILAFFISTAAGLSFSVVLVISVFVGVCCAFFGFFLVKIAQRGHIKYIEEQLSQGGLPLWINLEGADKDRIEMALKILIDHKAYDVHIH